MKKIIYRKLASDCSIFFLLVLLTISIIIWVLQAVNYLDFVVEDGHGFLVYFNYTLLNFPKIFSRVFPFAIFIAFSYILLKYEDKNELVIFWNFGIKKIHFVNFFVKFSFFFILLSLLLNALIVPYALDKARSFIRSSDLNFFQNILKPKKFIDIVENLTIYYDEKSKDGEFKNIFLNDKSSAIKSQTIFAKKGAFEQQGDQRVLILYDGKTINYINGKISEFKFSKTNFNITKFSTKTTVTIKIQETSTKYLMKCLRILQKSKTTFNRNCEIKNLENIYQALYSRLIKPLYITFLITITLLFILKSKSDHKFKASKLKIYSLGFLFIVFLESSPRFITIDLLQNLFVTSLPFIFVFIIYIYFFLTLRINRS